MEGSEECSLRSLEKSTNMNKVRHSYSEPMVSLGQSLDDGLLQTSERANSIPNTTCERRKLGYSQSFRSIKDHKIHKNIVSDSPYNNAALLDKLFGKVDLKTQLQEILSTYELCFLFRQFLEQQRCVENLDFYVDVELLKKEV